MPNGAASLGSDYRIDSNRGLPVQIQNQPEVDLLRDQSTSAGEPIDLNNGLSRQEADQFRKVDSNGAVRYEFETETPSTFTIEINGQPISVNYDGRLDAAEIRRLEERALATEIENNPALEGYTIFRREDGTLAAQAPSTVRSVPVSPEQEQAKRQELLEANPGLTNEQINREIDGDGNVILSATLTTPPSAETIQRQIVEFAEANGVDPSQVVQSQNDDASVTLSFPSRVVVEDAQATAAPYVNPDALEDESEAFAADGFNNNGVIPLRLNNATAGSWNNDAISVDDLNRVRTEASSDNPVVVLRDRGADGYLLGVKNADGSVTVMAEALTPPNPGDNPQQLSDISTRQRINGGSPNATWVTTAQIDGEPTPILLRTDANGKIVESRPATEEEIAASRELVAGGEAIQQTDTIFTVPFLEGKKTIIPPNSVPIEAIIPPGEEEVPGIVYVGNNQRGDRVGAYAVPFTETHTERDVDRFGPRLPDAIKTRYREGAIDLSTALSQVAASSTEELTSAFRAASRPVLTEEVLRKDGSVSSEVTTVGNWQFTPSVELPGNGDQNSFYTSSAIGLGDFRLNTNELYTSEADASAADQQLIEDAVYTEQAVLAFYAMKAEEYGYENLAEGDFALNAADQMELTGILTGQKVDANGQVVRTEQSFTDSEGNVWDLGARGIQWMPNSVPISYASSAAAPESIAQLEAYMNGTEAPAAPSGELTPSIERTPVSEVPVQVNDTQYLLTIDPSETEPGQAAIGVIHQQPLLSDSEQADIAAGGGEGVMSFGELDLETQEAMIQSLLQMAESGQLSLPTWTETSTDNRGNVTTREVEMTPADLEKLLREQMNQSALSSGFFPIHMMHSAA